MIHKIKKLFSTFSDTIYFLFEKGKIRSVGWFTYKYILMIN